jgi:hypothetical protein
VSFQACSSCIYWQVRTAYGLVLVATTHLLSPFLQAGQMNTDRRLVQFHSLLKKTIQAAGTDDICDDMVVTGDFNWNEAYVPHGQHVPTLPT